MYQVVLNLAQSKRVHVVTECATKEQALDEYMKIVESNNGSPQTPRGQYTIRKKP